MEEHGPLRLFVAEGVPWPYYARPSGAGEVTAEDVRAVRSRQWELGEPEAFEWIVDLAPSLGPATRGTGLSVMEVPLMVLDGPLRASTPPGARVRRLEPDDPELAAARAVADLALAAGGMPGRSSATPRSPRGRAGRSTRCGRGWPPG